MTMRGTSLEEKIAELEQARADDAMLRKNGAGLLADMLNPNGGLTIKQLSPKTTEQQLQEKTIELKVAVHRIAELEAQIPVSTQANTGDETLHPRTANNAAKIIAVLADMAGLPINHPFTAFNMMEAHAALKRMQLPSKDNVAGWLKEPSDSN